MMKKLIFPLLALVLLAGCSKDDNWGGEPLIPVTLKGIEAMNMDNSGEYPEKVEAPRKVQKNAYMIGIKWIADDLPSGDNGYIGGPIHQGQNSYATIADNYRKRIRCLTQFNAQIKPTTDDITGITTYPNISEYFQEAGRAYLPEGIDEGFVLLKAPDAGVHSFRVEYLVDGDVKFVYNTPEIEFY